MTPKINAAMAHVRSIFPDIRQVEYSTDGDGFDMWLYTTATGEAPNFDMSHIDVDILNDAMNEARELGVLPLTFRVDVEGNWVPRKWRISVMRTSVGYQDIEVEADTDAEARSKALDKAGDLVFTDKIADYSAENIQGVTS